jgi:hypothetical protein
LEAADEATFNVLVLWHMTFNSNPKIRSMIPAGLKAAWDEYFRERKEKTHVFRQQRSGKLLGNQGERYGIP